MLLRQVLFQAHNRDKGVKAIEILIKKKKEFDCVLLETTGLADPAPIASMFWLDDALQSELYLDGIVTVVDAKFIVNYLKQVKEGGEINEATKQIALADRIILNKIDLVNEREAGNIEEGIRGINSVASIAKTSRSQVDLNWIFDLHSFDQQQKDPFAAYSQTTHKIDPMVKTVTFSLVGIVDRRKLDTWLQHLLWEHQVLDVDGSIKQQDDVQILRFKALVDLNSSVNKHVVQAVQELFDIQVGSLWGPNENRFNKLVFIGRNLDVEVLEKSFTSYCVLH